jgi:LytTr DNA-binding domain-containing protein
MLSALPSWNPSFWRLQAAAWTILYALLLLAALPHLTERDVFRYNTVGCVVLFCLSLALRPFCRRASARLVHSWLALEASVFVVSLMLGMFASFAIGLGTFGWARLNGSSWSLSWLQCGAVIFLWCNLYISIKHWKSSSSRASPAPAPQVQAQEYATQFAIRAGSRIQIVYEKNVLWISASRDYAELHTPSGTFLLRETMQSLQRRLDPARFVRIHRSRIVRCDQIAELSRQDNGEYRVKLIDGSVHRSSRTFAPRLENWLRFGTR